MITPEQLAKLPKWAQEHITDIQRQRNVAVRALDDYVNTQKPSPFFTEDHKCTGEQRGPTPRRGYIQAQTICVEWRGVRLRVDANDYGQNGPGIRLSWSSMSGGCREVAFVPISFHAARLVQKEDMA